jgi:hypothetical protein
MGTSSYKYGLYRYTTGRLTARTTHNIAILRGIAWVYFDGKWELLFFGVMASFAESNMGNGATKRTWEWAQVHRRRFRGAGKA